MKTYQIAELILNLEPMTRDEIAQAVNLTREEVYHAIYGIKASKQKYTWSHNDGLFKLHSINEVSFKKPDHQTRKDFESIIERVKAYLIAGKSFVEISNIIEMTRSTLIRYCDEYGLRQYYNHKHRPETSTDILKLNENRDLVINMLHDKKIYQEIADHFDVNICNVKLFVKRHNLRAKKKVVIEKEIYTPKTDIQKLAFGKW